MPLLDKQARAAVKKARKEARRAHRKENAEASAEAAAKLGLPSTAVNITAAISVANRSLPVVPTDLAPDAITICLMYQYKEPAWTTKQHKVALNTISALAGTHSITGRGRCAPEGLNCTLTSTAADMRSFCYALRSWDSMFDNTDFKLEDGVEASARFRTFTLRKVDELVGYGLDGIKAPSLNRHAGTHLEAHQYHEQMQKKDTVIIDVRNAYESAIGHFQPPKDGATLLDPQMRNSTDFPKWLNAEGTREKLKDKTVMMYCTGGIRCERATALLNQMTEAEEDGGFKTKDVVMVRGGIERYLKTFPEGGFWKGKNYLFDKRMEQVPKNKTTVALTEDVESWCCLCKTPCSQYRGQHKCSRKIAMGPLKVPCSVPVIVCSKCQKSAIDGPEMLACPLCVKGYETPSAAPDLVSQKRKLGIITGGIDDVSRQRLVGGSNSKDCKQHPSRRLFVGRLPLRITASRVRQALALAAGGNGAEVTTLQWIVDHKSQAFYGSVFCEMTSVREAEKVVDWITVNGGLDVGAVMPCRKKQTKACRGRVSFSPLRTGETWPAKDHIEMEYPPIGT